MRGTLVSAQTTQRRPTCREGRATSEGITVRCHKQRLFLRRTVLSTSVLIKPNSIH